jgi:hypothetical protein
LHKLPIISCIYDWRRGRDIEDILEYSSHFTDVVHTRDKYSTKGIAFISLDSKNITHIMSYNKSGRVATKIDRLTFKKQIEVLHPITFESIEHHLPPKLRRYYRNQTSIGISAFSPNVYHSMIEYIKKSYPDVARNIEMLQEEVKGRSTKYHGRSADIAAHEKDAISLALRISGFTNDDIPNWSHEDKAAPFLKGYDHVVLREDPMIVHDSQIFGDWKKIQQYVVGAAEFVKEGHRLTIMNLNRLKMEETLGVDLLMYHHTYKSYLLIQYKRMTKDGDTVTYRPTDHSYFSEISRMEQFKKRKLESDIKDIKDFRLNDEFFYFKLCQAEIKEPLSTQMIPGMYLPISYWKLLISSSETLGKKGGRLVNYNNVQRYINNTVFIELVQNGWIGSKVGNTELITQQIQESIKGGNSMFLANYTR